MSIVCTHMTTSLDGYVAGPNQGLENPSGEGTELGGAIGIAVLGSIGTAIDRAAMADSALVGVRPEAMTGAAMTLVLALAASAAGCGTQSAAQTIASAANAVGHYARVSGLDMYYEVHGAGRPLVLLHGNFDTVDSAFGALLPPLAKTRRVIAIEQQGHGHTADVARPLTYEQMAEDTAALLERIGIKDADVIGVGMGGVIALGLASRHPALVRKLVVATAAYARDGYYPQVIDFWKYLTPEGLAQTPYEKAYARVAPNPANWPLLVSKVRHLMQDFKGWSAEAIRSIKAPALVIVGDSDIVRPEHTLQLVRLLGGGVPGDVVGLPPSRLAVLPGTTHTALIHRTAWLLAMIGEFLDAPMPGPATDAR
jgi:pimeloyl-ACP methyl ester carboxylesterase